MMSRDTYCCFTLSGRDNVLLYFGLDYIGFDVVCFLKLDVDRFLGGLGVIL